MKTAHRTIGGEWEWPPVGNTLETAGPIKEYVQRSKSKMVEQVDFCTIYKMCTGAERIPGYSRFMRCWDQDVGQEVE